MLLHQQNDLVAMTYYHVPMSYYVVAMTKLSEPNIFHVNLQTASDVALHFNPHYNSLGYIVHNSRLNSVWGNEENKSQTSFPRGHLFALQILSTLSSYKISTNGKPFSEFKHYMPFSDVDEICMDGMVRPSLIAFQYLEVRKNIHLNTNISNFIKLSYNTAMQKYYTEQTVCTCYNYLYPLLYCIFSRFNVNLQHGADVVALQVNPRYQMPWIGPGYIVHNTHQNGTWGWERKYETPFPRGQTFSLQILVTQESYKILANGKLFSEYKHRMLFSDVDRICVVGMVELSLVTFYSLALRKKRKKKKQLLNYKYLLITCVQLKYKHM
uniref:Galectin n=1 Tax=Cyprinus carpio TaxID=7962 RepID=A0A8C1IVE1_CYPCA